MSKSSVAEQSDNQGVRVFINSLVQRHKGIVAREPSCQPSLHPAKTGLFNTLRVNCSILSEGQFEFLLLHTVNLPTSLGALSITRKGAFS